MDVFKLRDQLIEAYGSYITSFIKIRDGRIQEYVRQRLDEGLLWPEPLVQLNPAFEPGGWIDELVAEGLLHPRCRQIFCRKNEADLFGQRLRLHRHQVDAIRTAKKGGNYLLTTGTGSGKSLAYIIPIVNHILQRGSGRGTQAIIVYPMNALANSQMGELHKFLKLGFPEGQGPVTFERYTGQEDENEKQRIMANPPDILLTNYVMLELILTRPKERATLVNAARGLRFLVLDELHTYRGRQGADVAMLVRRVRNLLEATELQCVGTSATLASSGSLDSQRQEAARVASSLFGAPTPPENVIMETVRRATLEPDSANPEWPVALTACISGEFPPPASFDDLVRDPLAQWIESNLGLDHDQATGQLVRAAPRPIYGETGAARQLSLLTGQPEQRCAEALMRTLNHGFAIKHPDTGLPSFAFRVHQFISRGNTVYATLESEDRRYLTVSGQKFAPGDRGKLLLPLTFCRECGQEYYMVRRVHDRETGETILLPLDPNERRGALDENGGESGYLYLGSDDPWPADLAGAQERLPEDWLEEQNGQWQVRRNQRRYLPEKLHVTPDGRLVEEGNAEKTIPIHFVPAPFRFCLHCTVVYNARQTSDYGKLTELSSGGRSTDTTILSLALVRSLRKDEDLDPRARKLLSFTDNRQDASLQAGHFNDFIEIALLRAALYQAARKAGPEGITHEVLPKRVFEALGLRYEFYAIDPSVQHGVQRHETERALREVLAYRLYRDLKRGWRVTSPNLEQCGLLELHYLSLDELCAHQETWQNLHPLLANAPPETRYRVCKVLLDYMRRELAIRVDYLSPAYQESLRQLSSQRLKAPWALDEFETLERAAMLFPRSRRKEEEFAGNAFLSPRGGYGQFLRRHSTFTERLPVDETRKVIQDLLNALNEWGLVEKAFEGRHAGEVNGYQVPASALVWKAGDGQHSFDDPIRVPRQPAGGGSTNRFFVDFYRHPTQDLQGLEAHEHTAQVPSRLREDREACFRSATLPVLFCSPTMELGVDISELNAVNMRNAPPTPANYAQRSGRAGRQGQPALVFTYCTTGSPHDQYYFKRPVQMVRGAVTPPRLDLVNEDLLRAHLHAVWLAESGQSLGESLKDILDLSGDTLELPLREDIQAALASENTRLKARQRAARILATLEKDLLRAGWYQEDWLKDVFDQIPLEFERACERWRSLYRAAKGQQRMQQRIIDDMARPATDRDQARRLRREAESQLELLTDSENVSQSDFYSYRYFASEGFLPGYSFPRLPLSAYIPGRRFRSGDEEFLSRPRFLAISEFGPRAIIYHEGSRYIINKVNIPIPESGEELQTERAKQCPACGYYHPIGGGPGLEGDGPDRCERCDALLDPPLVSLFRMQNVSTRRRDRINSDEEERMRQGYNLRTAVRLPAGGQSQLGELIFDGQELARITYAGSATLWRLNLGWRRREKNAPPGFLLDIERGYWARQSDEETGPPGQDDPLTARTRYVIPYVQDTKNCLLFEPVQMLEREQMASLQAALKTAIQVRYQLEDNELAAEPLPSPDQRRLILFYEAAEGGAGVLNRLLEDPTEFARLAEEALRLCHFDPQTGADLRQAPGALEACEAACYDCLMSYSNQVDHRLLDRQAIRDLLLDLAHATARISPLSVPRAAHLELLRRQCQSDLERDWLDFLEARQLNLPSHAQKLVEACHTRPDFLYENEMAAIYVDGYHHLFAERRQRDQAQTACMKDLGYTVLRFGLLEDWEQIIQKYGSIFGLSVKSRNGNGF